MIVDRYSASVSPLYPTKPVLPLASPLRLLRIAFLHALPWIALVSDASELILNGSFENILHDFPAGWSREDVDRPPGTVTWSIDDGADQAKSLRVDVLARPISAGSVILSQSNLVLRSGEKYILSFKARSPNLTPNLLTAEIRDKSQPDPPAVRITVSVNDEWQDFSEEFVPAVDIAGIHSSLQFILAASGTLLLDQVRLIGGGSRPERNMPKPQPRLPPATVRNLIPNGSFECGADGWLSLGKALSFGGNIAGLYGEVVTGGASEGARSFRLKLGPGLTPESYFDCWPPQHAVHHRLLTVNRGWIDVQRDRSYTLSAYMRSDRPGTKGVLQFNFSGDARNGVQTLSKEVQLTTAWARYSYTVVAPEDSVFVGVGPDVSESPETNVTFWTDALQLEVGTTATPYVGEPVEVGFSTGRYGNVFTANEPFAIDVSARNSTAAALALEIRAALTDYWDRPMPEKSVILEISAGTDAATTIPLDLPPGFYRARV